MGCYNYICVQGFLRTVNLRSGVLQFHALCILTACKGLAGQKEETTMRKFKYWFLCLSCLCGLVFVSCGKEDEMSPEGELPGQGEVENESGGEVVKPNLDEESLKFVGVWQGMGPYSVNYQSYGLVDGTWSFKNDSTYSYIGYNSYGYSYSETGKWRYNTENKMLITDSHLGFVWQILELRDDAWLGTLLNEEGGTYNYTRKNSSVAIHTGQIWDINPSDITVSYTLSNIEYTTEGYKYGVCISTDRSLPDGMTNYYYEDAHSEDTLIQIPNLVLNTTYYYSAVIDINGRKVYGDTLEYTHHHYDNAVFMGAYSENGKPLFVATGNLIMRSDGSAYIAPSGDYLLNRSYSEGLDEWDKFQWGDVTGKRTAQTDVVTFYGDTWDIGGRANQDIARAKLGGLWRIPKNGEIAIPTELCESTSETRDLYTYQTWTNKFSGKSITFCSSYYRTPFKRWTSTGYRIKTSTRPITYEKYVYVTNDYTGEKIRQYDFNFIRPVTE